MPVVLLWIASALSGPARAGCTDPAEAVDQARTDLLALRNEQATADIEAAEADFACGPWTQPIVLARLWLAEGALSATTGRAEDASDAFAAAARIAPGLWDAAYGPDLYEQYKAAAAVISSTAAGELRVKPDLGENEAWVDGRPFNPPGALRAGLHLIQVGPPGGPAIFARLFVVAAGEAITVNTGLPDEGGAEVASTTAAAAPPPSLGPEAAAIRRAATRDWGNIEYDTRVPDHQAERLLKAYIRRYGHATVKVDGQPVPVDVAQVREAQGRLDALPAAAARLAANNASKQTLNQDFRDQAQAARTADDSRPGLRGPTLRTLGALTRASAGDQTGEGYGGLGLRAGIGVSFAFSAHLGVDAEIGYHSLSSAPTPSKDPALAGVDLPPVGLQLGYGALFATLRTGDLRIQAGPVLAMGAGHLPASAAFPAATLADHHVPPGTPATSAVHASGAALGASWEGLHLGPVRLGPALELGALSDGDRLYPWGAGGLTLRWQT